MTSVILPLLFLVMPLAEIAMFIFVGREIGIGTTLLLVLASAVIGAVLLRVQGLGAMRRIRTASATGVDPGRELVHGVMIAVAAFLLIIPGFLSDIAGLLLFIPPIRDLVWERIKGRMTIVTSGGRSGFSRPRPSNAPSRANAASRETRGRVGPTVIDLDEDEFSRKSRNPEDDADRLR